MRGIVEENIGFSAEANAAPDRECVAPPLAETNAPTLELEQDCRGKLQRACDALLRKERQMDLVYAFERTLADDENPAKCIEQALETVRDALNAEGASILLCSESNEQLEFAWVTEQSSSSLTGLILEPGEGIASQVLSSGRPKHVIKAQEASDFSSTADEISGMETHDLVAFPLISTERTEGVLEAINSQGEGFNTDDVQLGEMLAKGLARSICRLRTLEKRRRAERLASVGRMTASIIHDLRNPLSVIAGYTDMLAPNDPEGLEEAKQIILRQVARATTLMGDLLDFCSGQQRVEMRPIKLQEFMEKLQRSLSEDLAWANLRTEVSWSAGGEFLGDPAKLDRVFSNLASNSRRALPKGGCFSIDCSEKNGRILFRVSDDGAGIPDVVREKLFEPFVTYGEQDGTGLGLAIIRAIIEAHGGTIGLGPGPGAVFLIELPRT